MVKRRKNRSWIISNKWFLALNVSNMSTLQCQVCKWLFSYANNTTTVAIRHLSSQNVTVHSLPHNSIAGQSIMMSAFLNASTRAVIPKQASVHIRWKAQCFRDSSILSISKVPSICRLIQWRHGI
jgi:hypothetical protein